MTRPWFATALWVALGMSAGACDWAGDDAAGVAGPLAVYGAGPRTCGAYGVNSASLPGEAPVFDCRRSSPTWADPMRESWCPAAQWVWLTRDRGNAYCAERPYTGTVKSWGSLAASTDRKAVVQEIAGLWVASLKGCSKNVRVCLGAAEKPAVGAIVVCPNGVESVTGGAGCAPCVGGVFDIPNIATAYDLCCPAGKCLRHSLALTMNGTGHVAVTSGFSGSACMSGTCTSDYSDLLSVTLTRMDHHVDWSGWSGACTGTADTCSLAMTDERSVVASYALGGTISGALVPGGVAVGLPRDGNGLVAARASTFRVDLAGSGYSFAQSGVCTCFEAEGAAFTCARGTVGNGSVTANHLASGRTRVFDVSFVAATGPESAGVRRGVGPCERIDARD